MSSPIIWGMLDRTAPTRNMRASARKLVQLISDPVTCDAWHPVFGPTRCVHAVSGHTHRCLVPISKFLIRGHPSGGFILVDVHARHFELETSSDLSDLRGGCSRLLTRRGHLWIE